MLTDLSPEEQAVLEELNMRTIDCVTPKMLEDNYLFFRFAKAREFNISEAETMLRKHVCWRKEFGIDTILIDYKPPEVLVKYVGTCLMCFDKEGSTVRYVDCGQTDIKAKIWSREQLEEQPDRDERKGNLSHPVAENADNEMKLPQMASLLNCATNQESFKYYFYRIEQDLEALRKGNKKKQRFLPIFDFENLPYAIVTNMKVLRHCLDVLKAYVDNYPELLKCAFVINAPFYFLWGFAVLKQALPDTVLGKVQIYGTDGWREKLLEQIDADVLPAFLGGNKRDPDRNPQCKTFVKRGEQIPKSYYMKNPKKRIRGNFKKMTILPFRKEVINFDIKETNSNLEWEYEIKSGDIDFSLHFKGETSDPVELIPKQRISTYDESEKGFFKCDKVGTYTIVLDNSYSWIYSKEVYYKAAIKPPDYVKNGELQ